MLSWFMSLTVFVKSLPRPVKLLGSALRNVRICEIIEKVDDLEIYTFFANKIPYFYRDIEDIIRDIKAGFFVQAVKDTLNRMPEEQSFKESHMGEIIASQFARDMSNLKLMYSKLKLLTTENGNVYKMDLVLYCIDGENVEIVFVEVKMSPKNTLTRKHSKSVYPSLFDSLREYEVKDREFDISLARDQIKNLLDPDRTILENALMPYSRKMTYSYLGIIVIDMATIDEDDMQILYTRSSNKKFEIDVVCIENLAINIDKSYKMLKSMAAV